MRNRERVALIPKKCIPKVNVHLSFKLQSSPRLETEQLKMKRQSGIYIKRIWITIEKRVLG